MKAMMTQGRVAWRLVMSTLVLATGLAAARPTPAAPTSRPLDFVTLERYADGPWATPTLFMARSPEEWKALVSGMADRGELVVTPAPPAPDVDWKRYAVVVVALGECSTSGYEVEVRSVDLSGSTVRLDVRVASPDGLASATICHPYHMVAVDCTGLTGAEAAYGGSASGMPTVAAMAGSPGGGNAAPGSGHAVRSWSDLKTRF